MRLARPVVVASLAGLLALAGLLTLAGCSSPGTSVRSSIPASAPGPVHASTSNDPFALPVDAHLLDDAQRDQIDYGRELLAYRCASQLGFTLPAKPVPPPPADTGALNGRRYGLVDLATARSSGYHVQHTGSTPTAAPDPFATLTGTAQLVVFGPSGDQASETVTNSQGRAVRIGRGGCLESAVLSLTGGHDEEFETSPVAEQINFSSYDSSLKQPRVLEAFGRWSSCMHDRGFAYRTPNDAINDKSWSTPTATAAEIRVAVADVTCKQQTNLVPIWNQAEVAIQDRLIATQASALAAADANLRQQVSRASAAIAAG